MVKDRFVELDEQIPQLAHEAFRAAFNRALASRPNVLIATDGALVRFDKDGNTTFVKSLPKRKKLSELKESVRIKRKMR